MNYQATIWHGLTARVSLTASWVNKWLWSLNLITMHCYHCLKNIWIEHNVTTHPRHSCEGRNLLEKALNLTRMSSHIREITAFVVMTVRASSYDITTKELY